MRNAQESSVGKPEETIWTTYEQMRGWY